MIFTKCSHAIATHLGPDTAWVFGVIEYWTMVNARKRKPQSVKNGLYCCYLSWADWHRELPFLSERTIRRCVAKLKQSGIIAVFEGDANSGKANYFTIDQKGWLTFQAWSSGMILSVEDGRALTPRHELVDDAELDFDLPDEDFDGREVVTLDRGGGQADQGVVVTLASSAHTLDIKNKNKEDKRNTIPTTSVVDVSRNKKTIDNPKKACKEKTGGSLIFEAYSDAYFKRYGFEPMRGKEANRWAKKIYEEVGTEEGQHLVTHYVEMNKQWFLQKGHSLEWCFRDLTEVKRSFHTGKTMTTSQIKQLEQRQTAKETSDEIQQSNGELASAWARIDTKRTIKI